MERNKSAKDKWMKVRSKTHPGRFYMFNRSTGEKEWLPPEQNDVAEVSTSSTSSIENSSSTKITQNKVLPRITATKITKTPAQDRLKRLQHNLKQERKNNSDRPRSQSKKPAPMQQENLSSVEQTGINRASKSVSDGNKKTPAASHEQQENLLTVEQTGRNRASKRDSDGNKKTLATTQEQQKNVSTVEQTSLNRASKRDIDDNKKTPAVTQGQQENLLTVEHTCINRARNRDSDGNKKTLAVTIPATQQSTTSQSLSSNSEPSIFTKIKDFLKQPFSVFKSEPETNNNETESSTPKKTIWSPVVLDAINEIKAEQKKFENIRQTELSPTTSPSSSRKNTVIPNYIKGSANLRLDRLRQSLLNQQQATTSANTIAPRNILNHTTILPSKSTMPVETQSLVPGNGTLSYSTNCLQLLTADEDLETLEMDWEPIENVETPPSPVQPSVSSASPKIHKKNKKLSAETMGEVYDTVNENLLRLSAEKIRKKTSRWCKDFYYFVVDTNVLLDQLHFLEEISRLKLCDTHGSVLYIPYAVLQELDRLKMRPDNQKSVKTIAVRAIKYLNKKFENNNLNLQAQTAGDERQHLIDVNSADDSIINCCLQVKEHIPNLVLLTEDVNLQNKAICNHILVTTKSELLYKRFDDNNKDGRDSNLM